MRSLKWLTEVKRGVTVPSMLASLVLIFSAAICALNDFTNPLFSIIISFEAGIIFSLAFVLFTLNAVFGEREDNFQEANAFLDRLSEAPSAIMNQLKSQKVKIIDSRTKGSAKRPIKVIGEKGEEY